MIRRFPLLAGAIALSLGYVGAHAADPQPLMRKSGCFKCHSIDKKKDAPSYQTIAEKYRGKADAAAKLYTHLTTNPMVEIDGKEETHDSLKTKNDADVRAVVDWILAR